jgi:hypothetical protein
VIETRKFLNDTWKVEGGVLPSDFPSPPVQNPKSYDVLTVSCLGLVRSAQNGLRRSYQSGQFPPKRTSSPPL